MSDTAGGSGRLWTTERPPHVARRPGQVKTLLAVIGRMNLRRSEQAVLEVIVRHANGAGFAWLLIETIKLESGCHVRRTVQRATRSLGEGESPLLESYPFLRTPENAPPGARGRARRGQGGDDLPARSRPPRGGGAARGCPGLGCHPEDRGRSDGPNVTPSNVTP